jgi:hypothetical protein
MLPDSNYPPAFRFECAIDDTVAPDISSQLNFPKKPIARRARCTSRAGVPEATVDENGNLGLDECKIGSAYHSQMSSPSGQVILPENDQQCEFRFPVAARFDSRHQLRAFLLGEDICHGESSYEMDPWVSDSAGQVELERF